MMRRLHFALEEKSGRFWIICLLSLIYFMRIAFLDADVPAWGVSAYQPIDEGIYATLALNMQNYGTVSPNEIIDGDPFLITSQELFNLPLNIVTYLGMLILGDNYFGFRIGSVLIGYINLVMLAWIVKVLFEKNEALAEHRYEAAFLIAILYIASFPVYIATRTVEPSIYRMTFVLMIAACYMKLDSHLKTSSFLIGFLTVVSIFLVYVTNVFTGLLIVGYLVRLIVLRRREEAISHLQYGMLGALMGYGVSIVYYRWWGITPLTNSLASILAFSGSANNAFAGNYQFSSLIGAIGNGLAFISANPVLYSIPVVALFVANTPALYMSAPKSFRDGIVSIELFVAGLFFQTLLTEDCIVRKMIIIYPLILVLGVAGLYLRAYTAGNQINGRKNKIASLMAIILIAYVLWERLAHANNMVVTVADYSQKAKVFIAAIGLMSAIPIALLSLTGKQKRIKAPTLVCLALFSVLNLGLIANYCILDRSYSERGVMQEIGEIAGDEYVAGDYSIGFTLYNDIKPVKNDRNQLLKFLGSHPAAYFLDYSNAQFFSNSLIDAWQTLKTEREFSRAYQNKMAGPDRNIALYKSTYIDY